MEVEVSEMLAKGKLLEAERIYERHITITGFLEAMGVGSETAAADACKIEHDVSDETFEAMKKYLERN